jgi:hypothetical protein
METNADGVTADMFDFALDEGMTMTRASASVDNVSLE